PLRGALPGELQGEQAVLGQRRGQRLRRTGEGPRGLLEGADEPGAVAVHPVDELTPLDVELDAQTEPSAGGVRVAQPLGGHDARMPRHDVAIGRTTRGPQGRLVGRSLRSHRVVQLAEALPEGPSTLADAVALLRGAHAHILPPPEVTSWSGARRSPRGRPRRRPRTRRRRATPRWRARPRPSPLRSSPRARRCRRSRPRWPCPRPGPRP